MTEIAFSECWYWLVLCAVVCYFIGCFNFAVLISHFKKKDIREIGSGNPGSMNMTRTFGLKVGVINFICDAVKGGLPALIGWIIFKNYIFADTDILVSDFIRYFCGVFVIIGHIFPVTMKFKGGKGIASTLGLFLFALPCERTVSGESLWWFAFIVLAFFGCVFLYIAITEWGSMASLIGVSGLTIWQAALFIVRYENEIRSPWVIVLLLILLVINVLTWWAHRKNILKLLGGEEHHTSVIKHKKK